MNVNSQVYQKKSHTGLKVFIVILVIFLVLIGLPIALVYIFFYDSGSKEVWKDDSMTFDTYMNTYSGNIVSNSMDATADTGKISFSIGEGDVNTLLAYALDKMDAQIKEYVPSAYLDINNGTYTFYVNAQTPFFPYFKTRVSLIADIDNLPSPQKGFQLTFKDAKIGRLGGLLSLADQFVDQSMIESIFKNTKMNFVVDWPNHTIKYDISSMLTDFNMTGTSDNIFYEMIDNIFKNNNNIITTDFKTGMNFAIDLSSAHKEASVGQPTFAQTYATIREENKNLESVDKDALPARFIEVAKANGEKPAAGEEIQNCLDDNKNVTEHTTYLTEEELTNYLRGTDLIGKTYPFVARDLKTKENKINFVTITDFRSDFDVDNKVKFSIILNVNGYDTEMSISATIADCIKKNDENKLVLNFKMDDIKYGDIISLWDNENNKPKQIVTNLVKDGFSMDGATSNINISGDQISIVINNEMYDLGNAINTEADRMIVKVFMPSVYSGPETVNTHIFETAPINGDRYFDTTNHLLHTYDGTNWDVGINVLDPLWLADPANKEIVNKLVEMGLIVLP